MIKASVRKWLDSWQDTFALSSERAHSPAFDRIGYDPAATATRLCHALLLAIVIAALAIRLFQLSRHSLWIDEGMTYFFATLDLDYLWSHPIDPHPPLYYTLATLALAVSHSEFSLRLISVLAGVLTVPVVYGIGRLCLSGPLGGLIAALTLTLSNVHVEYSQEARSYALATLFLALAVYFAALCYQRFADGPSGQRSLGPLFGYAAFSGLALLTHMVTIYYVFTLAAAIVFLAALRDSDFPRDLRLPRLPWDFVLASLAIGICWLLLFYWLSETGSLVSWLWHYSPFKAASTLVQVAGYRHIHATLLFLNLVAPLLCGLGFLVAVFRKRYLLAALCFCLLGVAPLLIWLTGFFQPILILRTILPSVIGMALAIAALSLIRPKMLAASLVLLHLALSTLGVSDYFSDYEKKGDWRALTGFLAANAAPGSAKLFCNHDAYWVMRFYSADALTNAFATPPIDSAQGSQSDLLLELDETKLRAFRSSVLAAEGDLAPTERQRALASRWPDVKTVKDLLATFDDIWIVDHSNHCKPGSKFYNVFQALDEVGFKPVRRASFHPENGIGADSLLFEATRYTRLAKP